MKNLVIFKGMLKTKDSVVVKQVDNFSNFKKVLIVFRNRPYNEILSEEECQMEYDLYMQNGYIFGCYVNDEIAGINCILNGVPSDYSIGFKDESKVAYYSGLAVRDNFRRLGLGKILVKQTEDYLESTDDYDFAFARILCEGSMSEGIFKQNGFKDAHDNGSLIVDEVNYLRNTGKFESDRRKYMVKRIKSQNNFYRR